MKKVIGIVTNHNAEEGKYWLNSNYIDYFQTYGLVTLINPLDEKVRDEIDLLVMPGGADCNPYRYNCPHYSIISLPNRAYEVFDFWVLPNYIEKGCPIVGICRGMQSLNLVFGGKLVPHLFGHPTSTPEGHPVHYISNGEIHMKSSSNHHQGVSEETLSKEFEALMWSYEMKYEKVKNTWKYVMGDKEDIVEVMKHKEKPIFCIQQHPEKNYSGGKQCKAVENYFRENVMNLLK